jgi:hypothetical protein
MSIDDDYSKLDERRRAHYQSLYEKYMLEYRQQLLLWYGGNKSDANKLKAISEIPEPPRKPIPPLLVYNQNNFKLVQKEFPTEPREKLNKILRERFASLPVKERETYQERFHADLDNYRREKESWVKYLIF